MEAVINIHHKKRYDVIVARRHGTLQHYGNPFSHRADTAAVVIVDTREEAVEAYRNWLLGTHHQHVEPIRRQWILNNLHLLRGKILGCWCKPLPCHGDILLELLKTT